MKLGSEILPLRIDLHVHTLYSGDSIITPKELLFYARKCGLDGVAVTDHDRLDSAIRISQKTDFLIVPGIEISSLDGHILGLNIQDIVPKGLTAQETVERIHCAGGIAIACHPTALWKGSLGNHTSSKFDAVEVVNSSAIPFGYSVKRSEQIASRLGIARVAGSDAHYGPEIGCAYTLVDAEPKADDVVNAIRSGLCQPFGKAIPMRVRLKREFSVLFKKSKLRTQEKRDSGERHDSKDLLQLPGRPCTRM